MAVFSVNANRQLYVATEVGKVSADSKTGTIEAVVSDPTMEALTPFIYFKYKGADTTMKSDYIPLKSIIYAKAMEAKDLADKLKQVKVTLDTDVNGGAPIKGQDYVLNITLRGYYGDGEDDQYIKFGCVRATKGMTAEQFYKKLAESLTKNFSNEITQPFKFESDADGLYIKELEQPWHLGTYSQTGVDFEVTPTTIYEDGVEVIWGKAEKGYSGETVKDGKKIADLEYFCMGERGDQYRNVGWPNVIPTRYLVDPDKEYNTLDIHYNFVDTGTESYKSEKEITIVAEDKAVIQSLIDAINKAAGTTIDFYAKKTNAAGGGTGGNTGSNTGGDDPGAGEQPGTMDENC